MKTWLRIFSCFFLFGNGLAALGDGSNAVQFFDHSLINSSEKSKRPDAAFQIAADEVTPKEACGLTYFVKEYAKDKDDVEAACGLGYAAYLCAQWKILQGRPNPAEAEEAKKEIGKKIPALLHSIYECVDKVGDFDLTKKVSDLSKTFKRKADLIEKSCERIGDLAYGGRNPDPNASGAEEGRPDIDFENPCLATFAQDQTRKDACFRSGGDLCKILAGKIEIENLIPEDIYNASLVQGLKLDLPAYVEGGIDGAVELVRDNTAEKLNDLIGDGVEKKFGYVGKVAIATMTASAKQIAMFAKEGNNDWSRCLGTANFGACMYDLFGGGIPTSHPIEKSRRVGDHEEINCCVCQIDTYKNDGYTSDTKVGRPINYISALEGGPFNNTLCFQRQNIPIRQELARSSDGYDIYIKYRNCHPKAFYGNVCRFPPEGAANRNLRLVGGGVLKPPVIPLTARKDRSGFGDLYNPPPAAPPAPGRTPSVARFDGYANPMTGPRGIQKVFPSGNVPPPPSNGTLSGGAFRTTDGTIYYSPNLNRYWDQPASRRWEDLQVYNPQTQKWETATPTPPTPSTAPTNPAASAPRSGAPSSENVTAGNPGSATTRPVSQVTPASGQPRSSGDIIRSAPRQGSAPTAPSLATAPTAKGTTPPTETPSAPLTGQPSEPTAPPSNPPNSVSSDEAFLENWRSRGGIVFQGMPYIPLNTPHPDPTPGRVYNIAGQLWRYNGGGQWTQ